MTYDPNIKSLNTNPKFVDKRHERWQEDGDYMRLHESVLTAMMPEALWHSHMCTVQYFSSGCRCQSKMSNSRFEKFGNQLRKIKLKIGGEVKSQRYLITYRYSLGALTETQTRP